MRIISKIFLCSYLLICFKNAHAQSGGPPMLTDDPGVVDLHKWEINTSFTTAVSNNFQIGIPYIDANYGVTRNLQLKVESPYLITIDHGKSSSELGDLELGVKFQFLNEAKSFISAGTYPQLVIHGDKGFLLPLLLEKTFGKFLIGEDLGFFFGKSKSNNFQTGTLLGYQATKNLQLMAEFFLQQNYNVDSGNEGYINFGFRQTLTKTFTLMGSFGTQVVASPGMHKEYFISFLGIQSHF